MTFQRIVTELAWGYAWNGTALDKKTKSMLSIAILAASGRFEEVEIYARGALRTGVSLDESPVLGDCSDFTSFLNSQIARIAGVQTRPG